MSFNQRTLLLKIAIIVLAVLLIVCVISLSNRGKADKGDTEQEAIIIEEPPIPESRTRIEYRTVDVPYEEVYVEPVYIKEIIEVEKPVALAENRFSELNLTEDDIELMARLVYHEARGESFTGQRMVAEVVLNRVLSSKFPNSVYDVIYQRNQFSPASLLSTTTATQQQYDAVRTALYETPITDANVLYFSVGAYNNDIFARIGGHVFCRG